MIEFAYQVQHFAVKKPLWQRKIAWKAKLIHFLEGVSQTYFTTAPIFPFATRAVISSPAFTCAASLTSSPFASKTSA